MAVEVSSRHELGEACARHVGHQARCLLAGLGLTGRSLSISLVGDEEIRHLNCTYRGIRRATDVLSFALDEGPFGSLPHRMLGDVIISVETAARRARASHRSFDALLDALLVHGILHLIGYDHTRSRGEARRMREKERELRLMLASFRRRRCRGRGIGHEGGCERGRKK